MNWIVVGFYTTDTPYEQEVEHLIESLKKFGIPYDIKGIPSLNDWKNNCACKPQVILDAMLAHPDKNIVYLDVDAVVMQYPKLFDTCPADVSVHYLNGKELLSGTIFLQNNDRVRTLINNWVLEQANCYIFDQRVLQAVLKEYSADLGIRFLDLPPTYVQIFDIMRNTGEPVITHNQASRRYRKGVNKC